MNKLLPVLIGSQAFYCHFKNGLSETSDWDFIHPSLKKFKNCDFLNYDEKTNQIICESLNKNSNIKTIETPIGLAIICPLDFLKLIYLSSHSLKKFKYKEKLNQLKNIKLSNELLNIYKERVNEISERIEKQKFFNNKITRFFEHDDLHQYILNSNETPMFKKILHKSSVIGSKKLFNQLSLIDKYKLISEEIFVFSLERYLIPNTINNPCKLQLILKYNFNTNTNACPLYYWLDKFAIDNGIKRYPTYISSFIRNDYQNILNHCKSKWTYYLENLPEEFWEKLLFNNYIQELP